MMGRLQLEFRQQGDACGEQTRESLTGEITQAPVCIDLNTPPRSTGHTTDARLRRARRCAFSCGPQRLIRLV